MVGLIAMSVALVVVVALDKSTEYKDPRSKKHRNRYK